MAREIVYEGRRTDGVDGKSRDSEFLYCIHCERVYKNGDYRPAVIITEFSEHRGEACPFDGCDGWVLMDGFPYDALRKSRPWFPERPISGERYPWTREEAIASGWTGSN